MSTYVTCSRSEQRKRILFVAEAATLAHVVRLIVLAKTLDQDKHQIHFACTKGYEHCLNGLRFTFWPLHSITQQQFLNAIAKGITPYTEKILNRYLKDDFQIIDSIRPDLIIGDNRFSLAISAPVKRIPYVTLTNAHWSPYSPLTRIPMPIPEHPLVNLIGLTLAKFLAPWFQALSFKRFAAPVNRLRKKHGLSEIGNLIHVLTQPGEYTLYADTPGFSPTVNLPPNHRYIGPILWFPETGTPAWWHTLPRDRPCVYVTFGSSGQVDLLPLVINALSTFPVNVLVATAGRLKLDALPTNVWSADYLPGTLAAQRARLVVCNGGSGTVHQALAAGVPVLGIASNMDQHLVMKCVTRVSAGLLLRAGQTTCIRIKKAVTTLLEKADYQASARSIAEEFPKYDVTREFPNFVAEVLGKQNSR